MMDTSIDLMQYAIAGGVIGILLSLIPVTMYLAGAAKRDAKREAKREHKLKKKEAKRASKKIVSEENQQLDQEQNSLKVPETLLVKEKAENLQVASNQAVSYQEAKVEQASILSKLQEDEQVARMPRQVQEDEQVARTPRQVQEAELQAEVLKQAQEKVQSQEEVRQPQEKMQPVQDLGQEVERQQVVLEPVENVQQVEAVNNVREESQLEKLISQLEQKSQELEAEYKLREEMGSTWGTEQSIRSAEKNNKQRSENESMQHMGQQVVSEYRDIQEPLREVEKIAPIILNFYKVSATQKEDNKRFVLDGYLTIGRNTGYHHWTIDDDRTVSGNHCKIYQRNNELYILDLNSTNGTYINGQRVRGEMKLSNHDKLRIGQSEYRLGL